MSTATGTTTQPKPEVKICEHIKDDGVRCGSPAIRDRHFCYHHSRCHTPSGLGTRRYRAPIPECIASLQLTIMQITEALGSNTINEKVAGKLLYAVQLSTNLLKMKEAKEEKNRPAGAPSSASSIINSQSPITNSDHPITSSSNDETTEVSPAMEAALAPHPVDPIDEPDPAPKPITRREYELHFEKLMTREQREKLRDVLGDGDANPAFNRATQRVTDHYNALAALQDAGITSDDPRLAPYV